MTDLQALLSRLRLADDIFPNGPMGKAAVAIDGLLARIASLSEALRPFATLGKMLDGPFAPALFRDEDSAGIGGAWSEDGERRFVTFGDLRRASAALGLHPDTGRRSGDVGGEG